MNFRTDPKESATLDLRDAVIQYQRDLQRAITQPAAIPSLFLDEPDDAVADRKMRTQRFALAAQNKSRVRAPFECLALAAMSSRTMGAGSPTYDGAGTEWVNAGNVGLVGPLSQSAYLFALGAGSLSVPFSAENTVPVLDTLPAWEFLLEDEEVAAGDVETDVRPLTPHTWAMKSVRITRRLQKMSSIDLVAEVSALALKSWALAMQQVALAGNATTSGGRQPDGLMLRSDITEVDATAGFTNTTIAAIEKALFDAGANLGSVGVMLAGDVFEKLLDTPVETGGAITLVGRSSASPTGYALRGGSLDGIPAGVDASMAAGSALFGDFAQLDILTDTVVDISVLRSGPVNGVKGSSEIFAFADFDVLLKNPGAFQRVINI